MSEPQPLSPAVLAGPILSNVPGTMTTVWRDGEIVRTDRFGRHTSLPPIPPLPDTTSAHFTSGQPQKST